MSASGERVVMDTVACRLVGLFMSISMSLGCSGNRGRGCISLAEFDGLG